MKTSLLLCFLSFSALAAECELTAVLQSNQNMQTSFVTSTMAECKALAEKTKHNGFFGLVDQSDLLLETQINFKNLKEYEDTEDLY